MTTSRQWHLVRRPHREPVDDDFALVEVDLPAPRGGSPPAPQVLVRNTYLSVDPYMRGRMNDVRSYAPPFALDAPMDGGALGVVAAVGDGARDASGALLSVGDTVTHGLGWRTYALAPGTAVRVVDAGAAPVEAYLGVLGTTGLTAYAGLLRVARMQEGDRVFVSAAAGAVGSVVGQIARLKGASRVVGSAGGPQKCSWLRDEAGFDAVVDYRSTPIAEGLAEAAPEGIDVYFDNVGGNHLEAAIGALRLHGRVAVCGMISGYNETEPPPGPRNLAMLIGKRLTMTGFLVGDHGDLRGEFLREVGGWLADGSIVSRETVVDGIENAVEAFRGLMRGANTGKMLVRLP